MIVDAYPARDIDRCQCLAHTGQVSTPATIQSPLGPPLADASCSPLLRQPITARQAADLAHQLKALQHPDRDEGGFRSAWELRRAAPRACGSAARAHRPDRRSSGRSCKGGSRSPGCWRRSRWGSCSSCPTTPGGTCSATAASLTGQSMAGRGATVDPAALITCGFIVGRRTDLHRGTGTCLLQAIVPPLISARAVVARSTAASARPIRGRGAAARLRDRAGVTPRG